MSEELENSVREMLKKESWTRSGISNFTKNNLLELAEIFEKAKSEDCEKQIKEICDEQLIHTKDSIISLYLSGMIAIHRGDLDIGPLSTLFDIFEKNHKEALIEYLLVDNLYQDYPTNKFVLKKLAEYYKSINSNEIWNIYQQIVNVDLDNAEVPKILAEHFEEENNDNTAISYYKKALSRYIAAKNPTLINEIWGKLVSRCYDDLDYFLNVQQTIAKTISEDRSAVLMNELYQCYKNLGKWDTAISILKLILSIDKTDSAARKELIECYSQKYADRPRLEEYISRSNLDTSFRDVFEAINDFEKHIAFDVKNFVFHRTWGVGIITKVQGDELTINFGKKNGNKVMKISMAVSALQPLSRDHIWVLKATMKKEDLAKKVKADVQWTLEKIIRSFENTCDDKRIKAELVPSILTQGEWTNWHAKAQAILKSPDSKFSVNPKDIKIYVVNDKELKITDRLAKEFGAEKEFFPKLEILMRYKNLDEFDPSSEQFLDMYKFFTNYVKSSTATEQTVAAYMLVTKFTNEISTLENPIKYSFEEMYRAIKNPKEIYVNLKDGKSTNLKKEFVETYIRKLPDWDEQYLAIFPVARKKKMIDELNNSGKTEKVIRFVQNAFNDYRNYRDTITFFVKECRNEEWFKNAGISDEKQFVTLVNIMSLCYREIKNSVNTVDNKKTVKDATALLFGSKTANSEAEIPVLNFMLSNGMEMITRMYTMINDLKELESKYKTLLRNGIIKKYPDYKFQEAELKQEAPKGLLVTAKMFDIKRQEAENLEKVELPKIAKEVAEAKAKGDLRENAEYTSAKEAQARMNSILGKLKEEISKAVVFDPTTVSTSYVSFGTTVTLFNNITNQEEVKTILGPWESNPDEGIISYLSALGDNLLDIKVGETKKFEINGRPNDYTVKSIVAAKF